jgi:hypothetical protein
MLMLYLFTVEVFDLNLNYPYSSNCVVVADTRESRGQLLRKRFGNYNRSVLRRSVLTAARALTKDEIRTLEGSAGSVDHVWLVTRIQPLGQSHSYRSLPRLYTEGAMYELLDRTLELYDIAPLREDQYIRGAWFSQFNSVADVVPAAA